MRATRPVRLWSPQARRLSNSIFSKQAAAMRPVFYCRKIPSGFSGNRTAVRCAHGSSACGRQTLRGFFAHRNGLAMRLRIPCHAKFSAPGGYHFPFDAGIMEKNLLAAGKGAYYGSDQSRCRLARRHARRSMEGIFLLRRVVAGGAGRQGPKARLRAQLQHEGQRQHHLQRLRHCRGGRPVHDDRGAGQGRGILRRAGPVRL